MGDYEISGNPKHSRKDALDYVLNKFKSHVRTAKNDCASGEITDLVVDEVVTVTHGVESSSFTAHLEYNLIKGRNRVLDTDARNVGGKPCKTKRDAVNSLNDEIAAINKKSRTKLQLGDRYHILEDTKKKTFVAHCYCERVFASEEERKNAELSDFNRNLDEVAREVDGWPYWKRGGV